MLRPCLLAWLLLALLPIVAKAQERAPESERKRDDGFVAGYVAAILERELRIPKAVVQVKDGVVMLDAASVGSVDTARVQEVLSGVPGVVRIQLDGEVAAPSDQPRPAAVGPAAGGATQAQIEQPSSSFLSNTPLLFEPLHADPRWPHFAASYHSYHGNDELENVGAVSFGESFSLFRRPLSEQGQWELGLQAGVFAIFDLDAASKDLVNADYFIGPVAALRHGDLSLLARLYHQSSHLGDEYLLNTRVDRVNLSYEAADLLVSYDVVDPVRVYVGGGYLLHATPDLDPWLAQAGVEVMGPPLGGGVRPLAAIDVQSREHHDWGRDVSVRAGVQFEDPAAASLRLQVLLEYYRGRSPNGQFLEQDIEFYGIGLHFYF